MVLAGACAGTLPTVILFSYAQKYFIQGIAASGIKG
jgi:ABC-type glycerol-3-phosphate transport system permease component